MRKDEILNKSLALINKDGLEAFSMRKLAEKLDCKPSSIYYYYQTKNDILNALYLKVFDMFFVFDDKNISSIEDFLYEQARLIQEHRQEAIFMFKNHHAKFLSDELQKHIEKSRQVFFDNIFSNHFCNKEDCIVDMLLIRGPLIELAFMDKGKLSEKQLRKLVKKIAFIIKEDD